MLGKSPREEWNGAQLRRNGRLSIVLEGGRDGGASPREHRNCKSKWMFVGQLLLLTCGKCEVSEGVN